MCVVQYRPRVYTTKEFVTRQLYLFPCDVYQRSRGPLTDHSELAGGRHIFLDLLLVLKFSLSPFVQEKNIEQSIQNVREKASLNNIFLSKFNTWC